MCTTRRLLAVGLVLATLAGCANRSTDVGATDQPRFDYSDAYRYYAGPAADVQSR